MQREVSRDSGRDRGVRPWRAVLAGGAIACGVAVAWPAAQAAMLDAESCRKIKAEHDMLGGSGIREMMGKGPEWGKANLTKDRLEQIKRFLSLDEDVRFRCPLGKARPELEAAESEAGAVTALQPGENEGAAKAAPAQPAKPARKTRTSSAPLPPPPAPPSDRSSTPAAAFAPAATEPVPAKPKTAPARAKAAQPKPVVQSAADGTVPAEAAPAETARKSPR